MALNVIQMSMDGEWYASSSSFLQTNPPRKGDIVFTELGIADGGKALIRWKIALFAYSPTVLIYTWATVTVAVFACNLLDDFRRQSRMPMRPSMAISGLSAEAIRRMSGFSGGSQIQTV
jgi:hypothetical protein